MMLKRAKKRTSCQKGAALTEILAVVIAVAISVGILVTKLKPGVGVARYLPGISPAQIVLGKGQGTGRAVTFKIEADATILYAKKAACRANVNIINTSIEMWHIERGTWPKENLSDIARDRDYFPNGIPKCPVNGTPYRMDPFLRRVVGHEHVDIPDPFDTTQVARKKRLSVNSSQKKTKKQKDKKTGEGEEEPLEE